jgi:hypothetical protein
MGKKNVFKNVVKNQQKVEQKQQDERDQMYSAMKTRCIPVAKEILRMIVEDNLEIGDTMIQRDANGRAQPLQPGHAPDMYMDASRKIQDLMLKQNLLWAERHMVFMLVKQPYDMLESIVLNDLQKTFENGLCRVLAENVGADIQTIGEMSMEQIDGLFKKYPVKKKES